MDNRGRKLQLLDILREKKRRQKMQRPPYVPNEGQQRVHSSLAANRFVFAGNGSGKTALAINECLWALDGYNPISKTYSKVPSRVYVVLDHPDKVKDVWIPELKKWKELPEEWLHKNGKPYVNEIRWPNGSFVKFMFHEQPELAFESLELDVAIFDEPPPRPLWIALKRGGRTKGRPARYIMIGTPIKAAWLRTEVYDKWVKGLLPDHDCFIYGSQVNKSNVDDKWYDSYFSSLSDKERQIREQGMFFDLDGLALAHLFKKSIHCVTHPQMERMFDPTASGNSCVVAIDPHPSKNHVAVMLGADREGQLYYIKELSRKQVARDFGKSLLEWMKGYPIADIVCDSLGNTDTSGGEGFRSFIEILNEVLNPHKYRVRATTYDEKSDEDFIERIRDVLKIPDKPNNFGFYRPKLLIAEGNPGIVKDIENVSWTQYKDIDQAKEKLDIRQADFLACLKYALAANPTNITGKTRVYTPNKQLYGMGSPKKGAVVQLLGRRKNGSRDDWDDD